MTAHARRRLGAGSLEVAAIGVGTWQWGDRGFWGYGREYGYDEVAAAYAAARAAGLDLFDTAEIYGAGESERMLGAFAAGDDDGVVIATKYFPAPNRLRERSVHAALDRSLERLGVSSVDLYQIHWPLSLVPHAQLARALATAVRDGRVGHVGVSNFSAGQLRRMHARLADLGVPLIANQVRYSLLRRAPEVNGVLEACHELDIALIAYSPLAQGVLSGRYDLRHRPSGPRRLSGSFRRGALARAMPVVATLREIAASHGVEPSQVALAWLLRDERVVPIPGAKTARQARSNAAACGVRLSADELGQLDAVSRGYRRAPWWARRVMG